MSWRRHILFSSLVWLICQTFLCVCLQAIEINATNGDWTDQDSAVTSWQAQGSDGQARFEQHRVTLGSARDGQWSESATLVSGHGTYAYLSRKIPTARIHPDLSLSLQVRSERAGVQLLGRVIFPHTQHPTTKQPHAVLIRGQSTTRAATWETLALEQVETLVERQARVLRAQYGKELDLREPYLDLVLLNAYTGIGTSSISWDDLRIKHLIEASSHVITASGTEAVAGTNPTSNAIPSVKLQGSVLQIADRSVLPRVIEYQGESLTFLASLGFNAIRVATVPTRDLLLAADQAGMWIIAPAPWQTDATGTVTNLELATPLDATWDRVMMWSLGQQLDDRYVNSASAQAKQLRRIDTRRQRPLISAATSDLRAHSRQADVLSLDLWPLGGSFELRDYPRALESRALLARPGTPIWALIPTQPATTVRSQWQALTGRDWTTASYDWDVLRLQVWLALSAGVRGLEYASHSRLDATDPSTKQRALALQLLNQELALIEPWAAAGTVAGRATTSNPLVDGVLLEFQNSRLLMLSRLAPGSQQVPAHADEALRVVVPGVPESFDALELNTAGIKRLKTKRVAGGLSMTIEKFDDTALVLLTSEPAVTQALNRRLNLVAQQSAEGQRQLANLVYEQTKQVVDELPILVRDQKLITAQLTATRTALDSMERQLVQGQRVEAYQTARMSLAQIGILRRSIWERGAVSLGSTVASPFSVQLNTMPIHWRWLDGLKGTIPQENRLPRGEMESLEALAQVGWRHGQTTNSSVQCRIELAPVRDKERQVIGQSLLLSAFPVGTTAARTDAQRERPLAGATGVSGVLETPPLWITTPALSVKAGEWLMIRGKINVPEPILGSSDGVLIMDSLGGIALAERMNQTRGWQEFVLYRIVPADGSIHLTLALTGYGKVQFDDVTIRSMGK